MNNENINMVLAHKLKILNPYLTMNANELIFNKPKEIYIDKGDSWEVVEDNRLDYDFLSDFLSQLANKRMQRFNDKYPHLSCELPSPYNRYRVQAQHKSSLFNSEIAICIRIPSKKRFELESFELSDKIKSYGWTYERIRELIRTKKNV